MFRRAILATALLIAGAATASAEVVFIGTIINTAVSPQCRNNSVGDRAASAFHPAKTAGNENFSGLSWVRGHSAIGHGLAGRSFDGTFRTVSTGGVGWGDTFFRQSSQAAQIKITSSEPPLGSITAATQTVILRGQVKRLSNDPGGLACVVSFLGTYVKDTFEVGS